MDDFRQSRRNWTAEVAEGMIDTSHSIFIAVMGVTGAGKSSFISLCSDEAVEVGHDLNAHTSKVDVYSFKYNSSITVYLIDTPGFDDTSRSDTEVLQDLAAFLTRSYVQKVKLNGIIYLHRITDIRMQGSAKKNLMMFKKLCGKDALKNVILATTMWSLVDRETGAERESQLISTPEFWGWMKAQGSTVRRHSGDRRSAVEIIDHFVEQNVPMTLDIQDQMVNQNRDLDQTSAGQELQSELIRERERFQAELRQVQEDMQEAIRERDKLATEALEEVRDEYMKKIGELSQQGEELKISMQKLHEANYKELRDHMIEQVEAHRRSVNGAAGKRDWTTPEAHVFQEFEKVNLSDTPTPPDTRSGTETKFTLPRLEAKEPIRFKDAVGRKFSFPFHMCATWGGMEELIKQAFLHVDLIGPHVAEGHYDLMGPNGEIILPQVWESMVEPGWAITMHMWPMPEPQQPRPTVQKILSSGSRVGPPPPPPPGWPNPQMPPLTSTTSPKTSRETTKGPLAWVAGKPAKSGSSSRKKN